MSVSCLIRTFFFFSSRRRHTRYWRDWSSDVCSSDLGNPNNVANPDAYGNLERAVLAGTARQRAHLTEWEQQLALGLIRQPLPDLHIDQIGRASCRERV